VKFDELCLFLIREGDGDPNYDINPLTLTKDEIAQMSKKSDKQLSLDDKEKRVFEIVWERETYRTQAKSKKQALTNVTHQIAVKSNLKPNAVAVKIRDANIKVKDKKWNVTY